MESHSSDRSRESLEDDGFILLMDLRPIVPLHHQHIRKLVRRGEFPSPVKVSGRTMFRRRDIREWCRKQSAREEVQA